MVQSIKEHGVLVQVARCGCCGRAVQFYDKQKKKYFMCNTSKQNPGASCYPGKIMATPINNAVRESLKVVLDCADNLDKKIRATQKDKGVAALGYAEKVAGLRKSLEQREKFKCKTELEFITEVADDCVANLKDKDREYLISNPYAKDYHLSSEIIRMVFAKLIPEYDYDNEFIESLFDDKRFIQLRAGV